MQKLVRLVIVLALIGVALYGWRVFASPRHIIRARLQQLANTASLDADAGTLDRVYKLNRITDFFTSDVVISCDIRGVGQMTIEGRDEVRQHATAALSPQGMGGLKTRFRDVSVSLAPDKQSAVANLTGEFTVDGQRDFYVMELNLMFKRIDGKWLIYRIETVKTLSLRPVFCGVHLC